MITVFNVLQLFNESAFGFSHRKRKSYKKKILVFLWWLNEIQFKNELLLNYIIIMMKIIEKKKGIEKKIILH